MKILVPADGSPYTKRMLAYLAAHDEWLGGQHQYTVITVVPGASSIRNHAVTPGARAGSAPDAGSVAPISAEAARARAAPTAVRTAVARIGSSSAGRTGGPPGCDGFPNPR